MMTGKMNRSMIDVAGGILLVSQFTLYGEAVKGNRPAFTAAAPPDVARQLFDDLVRQMRQEYTAGPVATGEFAADMDVALVNDGPVTIWLESPPVA